MSELLTGQDLYRKARDGGWGISRVRRMRGISVVLMHPRTGKVSGAFGHTEEAAWEAIAELWNNDTDNGPRAFWREEVE